MPRRRSMIAVERIERSIYFLRGQKIMLSTHLAELYAVETRVLVQAVKRNRDRFPADFMFQLTAEESSHLKSQIVISSWGGPSASMHHQIGLEETEYGLAMALDPRPLTPRPLAHDPCPASSNFLKA